MTLAKWIHVLTIASAICLVYLGVDHLAGMLR